MYSFSAMSIFLLLFYAVMFGLSLYIAILVIKALKIYIRNNSELDEVRGKCIGMRIKK